MSKSSSKEHGLEFPIAAGSKRSSWEKLDLIRRV